MFFNLELPRGRGWYPDPPTSHRACNGPGGGARQSVGGTTSVPSALAARGVARLYTPIASLPATSRGQVFDTVGYLIFAGATGEDQASWGAPKECRRLFLTDGLGVGASAAAPPRPAS